jgi:hypothetical protein
VVLRLGRTSCVQQETRSGVVDCGPHSTSERLHHGFLDRRLLCTSSRSNPLQDRNLLSRDQPGGVLQRAGKKIYLARVLFCYKLP